MSTKKPAISTLGELKASGWHSISIKDEIRKNLIEKIRNGEALFEAFSGTRKLFYLKFNMQSYQGMI